ncbi:MAG: hypothetical protein LQ351_003489 [Letrouitia transgressa]|nr:MAG: hypothetical protein LQ351_003489 [Letrouitia transgressa]
MASLHADVYPVKPLPTNPLIPLPDNLPSVWTPSTVTLIHSDHEAVVVDPLTTTAQAETLADWISQTIPHKTLKYIFITHGHGDHFFGTPILLKRFPGAIPLATRATLEHAKTQIAEPGWNLWTHQYPDGQIAPQDLSTIQVLDEKNPVFELEGHELRAVPVGHSDTDDTSVLWVPRLRLVVAGDAVYNSAFQWIVESPTAELRDKWIHAVEKVRALNPTSVVTGHKRTGAIDGVWTLDWTRTYLETWGKIEEEVRREGGGGKEMFWKVKQRFPDNEGNLVLWYSSLAQFGELPGF